LVAIIGAMDVPMVVMATRWFRGLHPVAPAMDPIMRGVLLLSAIAFSGFFGVLLALRHTQIRHEREITALEQRRLPNDSIGSVSQSGDNALAA
jgi:hypothetical protein